MSLSTVTEAVKQRADLLQLAGAQTRLHRAGRQFKGLCPFHRENTPSFHVDPERGRFHCFGCGASGDVIEFVRRQENLSFIEALKTLAERYGVDTSPLKSSGGPSIPKDELQAIHAALAAAQAFFVRKLGEPDGAEARAYVEKRRISSDMCREFGLGYAPAGWDTLLSTLKRQGFPEAVLVKAGLAVAGSAEGMEGDTSRAGRVYDRFRQRLTFPIIQSGDRVLGFSARALAADDKAKYINSPETPVYKKSKLLYGLHRARAHIRPESGAVLVEGNVDVIAMHQAGFRNTVAACGTAVTVDHLRTLQRLSHRLIVLMDGDTAGRKAAMAILDTALPLGLWPRVVWLPRGDPDDFIRNEGAEAMAALLAGARDLFTESLLGVAARGDDSLADQDAVLQLALDRIAKLPQRTDRELALRRAAEALGLPEALLAQGARERILRAQGLKASRQGDDGAVQADPNPGGGSLGETPSSGPKRADNRLPNAELDLWTLLLLWPGLRDGVDWAAFAPLVRSPRLAAYLTALQAGSAPTTLDELSAANDIDGEDEDLVALIVGTRLWMDPPGDLESARLLRDECLRRLEFDALMSLRDGLSDDLRQAARDEDLTEVERIRAALTQVRDRLTQLSFVAPSVLPVPVPMSAPPAAVSGESPVPRARRIRLVAG